MLNEPEVEKDLRIKKKLVSVKDEKSLVLLLTWDKQNTGMVSRPYAVACAS